MTFGSALSGVRESISTTPYILTDAGPVRGPHTLLRLVNKTVCQRAASCQFSDRRVVKMSQMA